MKEVRVKNVPVRFWGTPEMDEAIKRIACERDTSASSVYRDMVEKGLAASGYRSAQQSMQEAVRSTVDQVIQPHVDRLAAISAKAAQISAAAFFSCGIQRRCIGAGLPPGGI